MIGPHHPGFRPVPGKQRTRVVDGVSSHLATVQIDFDDLCAGVWRYSNYEEPVTCEDGSATVGGRVIERQWLVPGHRPRRVEQDPLGVALRIPLHEQQRTPGFPRHHPATTLVPR